MKLGLNDDCSTIINLSNVNEAWKSGSVTIKIRFANVHDCVYLDYYKKEQRDSDYELIKKAISETLTPATTNKGKTNMESLKEYVRSHKDTLFTLGFVLLIDHFLFDGALRTKVQATIENLCNKSLKKLNDA